MALSLQLKCSWTASKGCCGCVCRAVCADTFVLLHQSSASESDVSMPVAASCRIQWVLLHEQAPRGDHWEVPSPSGGHEHGYLEFVGHLHPAQAADARALQDFAQYMKGLSRLSQATVDAKKSGRCQDNNQHHVAEI